MGSSITDDPLQPALALAPDTNWLRKERERLVILEALLKRYLTNHCQNTDAEGMSALCECRLCLDTREALGIVTFGEGI